MRKVIKLLKHFEQFLFPAVALPIQTEPQPRSDFHGLGYVFPHWSRTVFCKNRVGVYFQRVMSLKRGEFSNVRTRIRPPNNMREPPPGCGHTIIVTKRPRHRTVNSALKGEWPSINVGVLW